MYLIARQAKFGYKNVMGDIQSKTIAKTIAGGVGFSILISPLGYLKRGRR